MVELLSKVVKYINSEEMLKFVAGIQNAKVESSRETFLKKKKMMSLDLKEVTKVAL